LALPVESNLSLRSIWVLNFLLRPSYMISSLIAYQSFLLGNVLFLPSLNAWAGVLASITSFYSGWPSYFLLWK
jgi:hypothetical protein